MECMEVVGEEGDGLVYALLCGCGGGGGAAGGAGRWWVQRECDQPLMRRLSVESREIAVSVLAPALDTRTTSVG